MMLIYLRRQRLSKETRFASRVLLIQTGLQPGEKALTLLRNRFNGFGSERRKTVETVFC